MTEPELVKTVFSNASGEKLLALWKTYYADRISYDPLNTPEQTAYREGERAFFLSIIFQMETENE